MAKFTLADGTEVEAFTKDEMTAQIDEVTGGLKAKVDELLGEKKTVSARAAELEEAARVAKENELKNNQEFKTLYEQVEQENAGLKEGIEASRLQTSDKNKGEASLLEASKYSDKAGKAKVLAGMLKSHMKDSDGVISFEMGGIEVPKEKVIEKLRSEADFLFDIQSSGSGAPGSDGSRATDVQNKAATEAKSKGDVAGFLKASLNQ